MKSFENRIKLTKQGYEYVEVNEKDCLNWGGFAVCDTCDHKFDKGYLVFVLNSCICEKCFKEWINRAKRYIEDLDLQNFYAHEWFKRYLDR